MSWETTQTLISLTSLLFTIGIWVIIFLIIRAIWRAFKKFIFEAIDRSNGNAPRSDAGKQTYTYTYSTGKPKYTDEARRACEEVKPKRKRDEKPPWEE